MIPNPLSPEYASLRKNLSQNEWQSFMHELAKSQSPSNVVFKKDKGIFSKIFSKYKKKAAANAKELAELVKKNRRKRT